MGITSVCELFGEVFYSGLTFHGEDVVHKLLDINSTAFTSLAFHYYLFFISLGLKYI